MGNLEEEGAVERFKGDIKQIVSRISRINVDEMQDQLLIREELGIDSLMAMEIIATCEKHLHLTISESLVADVKTVGDFLDLLVALSKNTSAS